MGKLTTNLIAARALIDTPDKWVGEERWNGSLVAALAAASPVAGDFEILMQALARALPQGYRSVGTPYDALTAFGLASGTTHADIMALFDRAQAKP